MAQTPEAERAAFEVLYSKHYWTLLRFAVRRLPDAESARDLVADTFATAWQRRNRIPPDRTLPWLYKLAGNLLANRRRRAARADSATRRLTLYSDGTTELELMWVPRSVYASYLRDRANGSLRNTGAPRRAGQDPAPADVWSEPIQIIGRTGTLFHRGQSGFTAILPPRGTNFVEIRTVGGTEQEYRQLVSELYSADVDTWLAALPESVVKSADLTAVIAEMLSDIPVPAGFDRALLNNGSTVERYHVGARVTGAVACAWIDKWARTRTRPAGDTAALREAREAVAALRSSHSWKILLEMKQRGDYPIVLWEYADLVAHGKYPVGYKGGLGCR